MLLSLNELSCIDDLDKKTPTLTFAQQQGCEDPAVRIIASYLKIDIRELLISTEW